MEDMEQEIPNSEKENDFSKSLLSGFERSSKIEHQHICTVVGTMSQEMKEKNIPLSPLAFFLATCSSMESLSTDSESAIHLINELLILLSFVLPNVPVPIVKKKKDYICELLSRLLFCKSLSAKAIKSGLKCLSQVLLVSNKSDWMDLSQSYAVFLLFSTDSRAKVRMKSNKCIRDILQSLRSTPLLVPASEGITKAFERVLLLANEMNLTPKVESNGVEKVFYVLEAVKECLPFMSTKSITCVLKYFKTLLKLQQPSVGLLIIDSMNLLCIHQTSEFPPEMLMDIMCSVSLSLSVNETSVSYVASAVRLLNTGMAKAHSLNKHLCVVKLPVIFCSLRDALETNHKEVQSAATETLKSLIHTCIDESLIIQGLEGIVGSGNLKQNRTSTPTIIEKICAAVDSLLDCHYIIVWDMCLQMVSALFDKLGKHSFYLLRGTLQNLADLQKSREDDFPYRKQLHECIGSALRAMGPENFLKIIPIEVESKNMHEMNAWLFPILKHYIIGGRLCFFVESLLGMVDMIKQKSLLCEHEGQIIAARNMEALVHSIWSLLPSFCNYPLDTAEAFGKLGKLLCVALREKQDVVGIICSSLQILIQQNKDVFDGKNNTLNNESSTSVNEIMAYYTSQIASDNLSVLRSCASEFLPVLSKVFMKSINNVGGCLQATIGDFATIADRDVVSRFFKSTMISLLKVTKEATKHSTTLTSSSKLLDEGSPSFARVRLFDVAASLIPGLNAEEIELLSVPIIPALKDSDGLIQKNAYKVLSFILKSCDDFIATKLDELLACMIEVLPLCHFSSKRRRLDCLYFIIAHMYKYGIIERRQDAILSLLTEIVLSLKEANKKTRNRAYEILVQIGHTCGDVDKGGKLENRHQLFYMVAAGLAGETPHMISAAVRAISRLAYEFTDLIFTVYTMLPSMFLLIRRNNKELTKANLGLVKVLVAKSQADGLNTHLKSMVEGLMNWPLNSKNKFKGKIKILLEMLVKKCGLDAVKEAMPAEHMPLLTNIRKIADRKARSRAGSEETHSLNSKTTYMSRRSKWNHTKIFSDFSERSDVQRSSTNYISNPKSSRASYLRQRSGHKTERCLEGGLMEDTEDDPLDLLERGRVRSSVRTSYCGKRKAIPEEEPEVDGEGRLVVREEGSEEKGGEVDLDGRRGEEKRRGERKRRKETKESGWAYTGSEYGSRKGKGDVKGKGKVEPYAYWPLDKKMVSHRANHRAVARKGMALVVKMTKKMEGKSSAVATSLLSKGMKMKKKSKQVLRPRRNS